jgi:hypothetical protein
MDEIWEARENRIKEFVKKNGLDSDNVNVIDGQDVVYDPEYGSVIMVDKFECILPNGQRIIELP